MKSWIPESMRDRTRSNMVVVAFGILLYGILMYFGRICGFIKTMYGVLSPFLIGIGIAFLLNALLKRFERLFAHLFCRRKQRPRLCRGLGVLCCYALLIGGIVAFCLLLVPQLVQSIRSIYFFLRNYINANSERINELLESVDFLSYEGETPIVMWQNILSRTGDYMSLVLSNVVQLADGITTVIYQFAIGLIASIYILLEKDVLARQSKKLLYAVLPMPTCESLIFWARKANRICSGFLVGKVIDSIIMGILCYIGMSVLRIEYRVLISVIIGITNILPFFGPIIGAVPSILILLFIHPYNAVIFAVFILAMQQLDGNVIGPYILGDSVGISPLWIMVSIIIGSSLFGFMGMLLAVPAFALIYAIVGTLTNGQLKKRGLRTASEAYTNAPEVPPVGSDPDAPDSAPHINFVQKFCRFLRKQFKKDD